MNTNTRADHGNAGSAGNAPESPAATTNAEPTRNGDAYTTTHLEQALACVGAIREPIERIHAVRAMADALDALSAELDGLMRAAAYEATLRPAATTASVAAEAGLPEQEITAAARQLSIEDRQNLVLAAHVLHKSGQRVPDAVLLGTADLLEVASVVVAGYNDIDPGAVTGREFELVVDAADRAQDLLDAGGVREPRNRWRPVALDERAIPYDDLDPGVVHLVRVFAALPGIVTISSCEGHPERGAHSDREWHIGWKMLPADRGAQVGDAGPHRHAWLTTEWLIWFTRDLRRAGYPVDYDLSCPPPYLNTPGEAGTFWVTADRTEARALTPDQFADLLIQTWISTGGDELDWPTNTDTDTARPPG